MADMTWYDFQVSPTKTAFIAYFAMAYYVAHTDLLDDEVEQHLGSEIAWWLDGPECEGLWHFVRFNDFNGPRTARHSKVMLFEKQESYDRFVEEFGAELSFEKARWYEAEYRKLKTQLMNEIQNGEYDLSKLGERYRRRAARDYLSTDKKIKKYRNKWSALKARAKEMRRSLEP